MTQDAASGTREGAARRALVLGLGGAAVLLLLTAAAGGWALALRAHRVAVALELAQGTIWAGAAWCLLRRPAGTSIPGGRSLLLLILGVAVAMRLMLLPWPPQSTDVYRYVWDGRMQAHGINPYAYVPADPALAPLRDEAVYPWINRATYAHTIYPPMAQVVFLLAHGLGDSLLATKAVMVAFDVAGIAAMLALLRRRGLPPERILLYAWHPLPLFEVAGSGHVDAAAVGLLLVACWLADRRGPGSQLWAGLALGAATLVKYVPVVAAPALWRRWDPRFVVGFLTAVVVLYLPYLSVGAGVLGFLPSYAGEENLSTGSGFYPLALLGELVPLPGWAGTLYVAMGAALLAWLGLVVLLRPDRAGVPLGAVLALLLLATVVTTPHYPWYYVWTVPFLCVRPSPSVMYLTAAAPLLHDLVWSPGPLALNAALYGPFAALALLEWRNARQAGLALARAARQQTREETRHA